MASAETEKLAAALARLLTRESPADELSSLRAGLERIGERLARIEARLDDADAKAPARVPPAPHPSQEKYEAIEALVDELLAGARTEKTCTFEPNGRPCDACSMCSSRGF